MARLRFKISMSLDGYVAGPEQSVRDPLGIGGGRLHEWAFRLAAFRRILSMDGGEVNDSTAVVEESWVNIGATIMGRNMFGGHPGPWDASRPWNGWWGSNPPFHHPVFVLTHHSRAPLALEGGTTFTFVTSGIQDTYELAIQAAGGRDVSLAGGARAARQYLIAGLIDEMELNLVPTLLGSGERLFEAWAMTCTGSNSCAPWRHHKSHTSSMRGAEALRRRLACSMLRAAVAVAQ